MRSLWQEMITIERERFSFFFFFFFFVFLLGGSLLDWSRGMFWSGLRVELDTVDFVQSLLAIGNGNFLLTEFRREKLANMVWDKMKQHTRQSFSGDRALRQSFESKHDHVLKRLLLPRRWPLRLDTFGTLGGSKHFLKSLWIGVQLI